MGNFLHSTLHSNTIWLPSREQWTTSYILHYIPIQYGYPVGNNGPLLTFYITFQYNMATQSGTMDHFLHSTLHSNTIWLPSREQWTTSYILHYIPIQYGYPVGNNGPLLTFYITFQYKMATQSGTVDHFLHSTLHSNTKWLPSRVQWTTSYILHYIPIQYGYPIR